MHFKAWKRSRVAIALIWFITKRKAFDGFEGRWHSYVSSMHDEHQRLHNDGWTGLFDHRKDDSRI